MKHHDEVRAEPLEDRRLLASWGPYPRLIEQDSATSRYPQVTGSGQAVAVIDTGIDYRHPALGGGFGSNFKVIAGYDFADNDSDPMDEHGHGTGVAAAIAAKEYTYKGYKYRGVAPDAKLIALRVDDDSSAGVTNRRIESALRWVLSNRARYNIVAVNLSLGEGSYRSATRLEPYGDELDQLFNAGVFLSAASGNDGLSNPPSITYPAAHPNVYAVGAVNTKDVITSMTERSADLDLLAPGDRVPLPFYDAKNRKHVYIRATGTSFATPFAAGAAALLKQVDPAFRPQDIITFLKDSGASNFDGDVESPGSRLTFKRLDLRRAIQRVYGRRDDKQEHNDSLAQAATVTLKNGSTQLTGLRLLGQDDDYYRFSISESSRVTMSLSASGAAPRFELYSSGGSRIADLGKGQTRNLNAGTYILKVDAGAVGMSGSYSISVTASTTPKPVEDDAYEQNDSPSQAAAMNVMDGGSSVRENLRLVADDHDYFTFVLTERMKASVSVSYSGSGTFPDGQLLNESLKSIASLPTGAGGSTSRELAPGRYYLHFVSSQTLTGTYRFTASVEAIPEPEPEPEPVVPDARYLSSAFDADGRLHVAFHDAKDLALKYQTRSPSGVWSSVRTVDDSANVGRYISIAVDAQGAAGIAYYDVTNRDLKYARQFAVGGGVGNGFQVVTVDASGTVGEFPSLRYDFSGRANIAYYKRTGGDLRYALVSPGGGVGTWTIETIDAADDAGMFASLAIGPNGQVGVAYANRTNNTVRYAERAAGDWSVTTVSPNEGLPSFLSLAFDPYGRPAFSFQDAGAMDLKLAWRQSADIWSVHSLALDVNVRHTALAFDGDRPELFYYDQTDNALFEASLGADAWTRTQRATGGAHLAAAQSPFNATILIWRRPNGTIAELLA